MCRRQAFREQAHDVSEHRVGTRAHASDCEPRGRGAEPATPEGIRQRPQHPSGRSREQRRHRRVNRPRRTPRRRHRRSPRRGICQESHSAARTSFRQQDAPVARGAEQAPVNGQRHSPISCTTMCRRRPRVSSSSSMICCHCPSSSFRSVNGIDIDGPSSAARTWLEPLSSPHRR